MDTIWAKFLMSCLVCELIALTSGVPVANAYYRDSSIKYKRSNPIESQDESSPFGLPSFSLPNIMSGVQQTLSSIGNLLSPGGASHSDNEENTTESEDTVHKKKRALTEPISSEISKNTDKSLKFSTSKLLVQSNTVQQNVQANNHNMDISNKKERTLSQPVAEAKKHLTPNELKNTNEKDNTQENQNGKNLSMEKPRDLQEPESVDDDKKGVPNAAGTTTKEDIDKSLLDSIFDDVRDSDTTTDYTTGTADYESTTTDDDIVRVPAAVVASLLG